MKFLCKQNHHRNTTTTITTATIRSISGWHFWSGSTTKRDNVSRCENVCGSKLFVFEKVIHLRSSVNDMSDSFAQFVVSKNRTQDEKLSEERFRFWWRHHESHRNVSYRFWFRSNNGFPKSEEAIAVIRFRTFKLSKFGKSESFAQIRSIAFESMARWWWWVMMTSSKWLTFSFSVPFSDLTRQIIFEEVFARSNSRTICPPRNPLAPK